LNEPEIKENFACKSNIKGSNSVHHYERKMKQVSSFAEVDYSEESNVIFEHEESVQEEQMKKKAATKIFCDESILTQEEPKKIKDQKEIEE
jgi:hypothetical protein